MRYAILKTGSCERTLRSSSQAATSSQALFQLYCGIGVVWQTQSIVQYLA